MSWFTCLWSKRLLDGWWGFLGRSESAISDQVWLLGSTAAIRCCIWASCLPCHSSSTARFHHPAGFFYNCPIKFSPKSWCNLWWSADLQRQHSTDCSIFQVCRFALHNIRPFVMEHAAQLLVQALVISRLDYSNALLAGLPSNTIIPLQRIQNAAARLVFNEPKKAHVTPLFVSLHWLPVAARIKFKTLMLAYRTTTGSAPS